VPLLPWLIPVVVPVIGRIAPFVESVTLPGGVQIGLQAAARPVTGLAGVERALTADHLVNSITTTPAPFTTTDAMAVIVGVRAVRAAAADAIVIDVGSGAKWRLPNLYFAMWILANDPTPRWTVFTETRGQTPAVFVGITAAVVVRASIESAYPEYASVGPQLEFQDPVRPQSEQQLTNEFNKLRAAVAPPVAGEVPTLAWVTAADLRGLLGPHLSTVSVAWMGALDREGLQTIVRASVPYVGATMADGRFRGVVDQRAVALEFARRALEAA
jgi:hypothetical protein